MVCGRTRPGGAICRCVELMKLVIHAGTHKTGATIFQVLSRLQGICRQVVGDRFLVHFVLSFLMLCILD